jgi:hypothetical protein
MGASQMGASQMGASQMGASQMGASQMGVADMLLSFKKIEVFFGMMLCKPSHYEPSHLHLSLPCTLMLMESYAIARARMNVTSLHAT